MWAFRFLEFDTCSCGLTRREKLWWVFASKWVSFWSHRPKLRLRPTSSSSSSSTSSFPSFFRSLSFTFTRTHDSLLLKIDRRDTFFKVGQKPIEIFGDPMDTDSISGSYVWYSFNFYPMWLTSTWFLKDLCLKPPQLTLLSPLRNCRSDFAGNSKIVINLSVSNVIRFRSEMWSAGSCESGQRDKSGNVFQGVQKHVIPSKPRF